MFLVLGFHETVHVGRVITVACRTLIRRIPLPIQKTNIFLLKLIFATHGHNVDIAFLRYSIIERGNFLFTFLLKAPFVKKLLDLFLAAHVNDLSAGSVLFKTPILVKD